MTCSGTGKALLYGHHSTRHQRQMVADGLAWHSGEYDQSKALRDSCMVTVGSSVAPASEATGTDEVSSLVVGTTTLLAPERTGSFTSPISARAICRDQKVRRAAYRVSRLPAHPW